MALLLGACAVDEPNPAIPGEMRRSLDLVEADLAMFDEVLGEPDYQATTDERCFDDDLYETRSYPVEAVDPMLEGIRVVLDEIRRELEAAGWDLAPEDGRLGSSGMGIEASTRREGEAIDVRVAVHGLPTRSSITVSMMFRTLAADLCPT